MSISEDQGRAPPPPSAALSFLALPGIDPLFWSSVRAEVPSAWWTHVPFAHWLVSAMRPGVIVELGSHAGVSYSAMCEGVKRLGLDTKCYAVDTWEGDKHAGGYSNEIFDNLKQFNDAHYASFSTMLRCTFDEALNRFADNSIDLLHIDGLHTYEAVKHDFESWRCKLTAHGVVLFHDTNEHRDDFGVWKLWAELCAEGLPHFEFLHGHGLGVLAVGAQVSPAVLQLCAATGNPAETALRERFSGLGDRIQQTAQLQNELHSLRRQLNDVRASVSWKLTVPLRKLSGLKE
jgi:hypothetical protein